MCVLCGVIVCWLQLLCVVNVGVSIRVVVLGIVMVSASVSVCGVVFGVGMMVVIVW